MGRKIPAKKHRGVKDPLQQQAKRLQILKTKINAPPADPDEQPVPRSLTELFSFRDRAPAGKSRKKPALSPAISRQGQRNPVSELRKLPGESARGFSLRINSAVRALHDSQEPHDYPQDLEDEDTRGERMAAVRAHRQRRHQTKLRSTLRNTPGADQRAPRRSHKDRLREKRAAAAEAAEAARRERPQYERVAFGDVAAAPPALPAPRRADHAAHAAPRPGRRDLLLCKLLSPSAPSAPSGAGAADRERRERARLDAVNAYRALKKQKRKQSHL